jgi:GNAT superfamily N-acetyltransferase
MTLELQTESLVGIIPEVQYLLQQHYDELTLNKQAIKLNPDWDRYFRLADEGKFITITARMKNELVGYSGFFFDYHIHYKDLKVATNDVLFLRKDFRQGMLGVRLLKYSEKVMKELGANKITWHIKHSNDFRPILHRMGYADEDIIVGKLL